MAYADDLLQLAWDIAKLHPEEAHQPSLRRALSTAYYALFHLLISDAISSCTEEKLRTSLARMFDHGPMMQASERKMASLKDFFKQRPDKGAEYELNDHLNNVAETFSEAQYNRTEADYNLSREWQSTEVSLLIERVADAFHRWSVIREKPAARDYLISMLPSREKKQPEKTRRPGLTEAPKGS